MISVAINIATLLLSGAILLSLWRVLRGPDATDRVLALDTLYINAIAMLVIAGIRLENNLLFQAALLIALLGFISTAAMCKFLLRGDIIE